MNARPPLPAARPAPHQSGFSLLELMMAVGLIGILAAIAIPGYQRYIERAKVSEAVQEMGDIQLRIERFRSRNMRLPDTLAEATSGVAAATLTDPWGRSYVFYNYAAGTTPDPTRRDKNLKPLNTDYDLYSIGKDGLTEKQLNNAASLDDVVRALDGSFIGSGKDF
jgi:general secretion pathway protein G